MRISLPRSITASMMVVYSDGAGVVPKGKFRHRKANIPTIVMPFYVICSFALMRWYAASRSFFLIRIKFEGHLRHMSVIMWSIMKNKKPQEHGCRMSLSTRLFKDRPYGPVKD